jgi:hypothetical protein
MQRKPLIELIIYAIVIVLLLIAAALIFVSPPGFIANKSVYQGF